MVIKGCFVGTGNVAIDAAVQVERGACVDTLPIYCPQGRLRPTYEKGTIYSVDTCHLFPAGDDGDIGRPKQACQAFGYDGILIRRRRALH